MSSGARDPGRAQEQKLASFAKKHLQLAKAQRKAVLGVPQLAPKAKFFLDPITHRHVTAAVFVELLISNGTQELIEKEFFAVYRHLFDGGSIDDLPTTLINLKSLKARVKNAVHGGQLLDETEDSK